jgi:hypothetical protein
MLKKLILSSILISFFPIIFVLGQTNPVSIDIKVSTSTQNFSDGPLYITSGSRIYLKWQGQAEFCYALGSWRGIRNPNGQTSYTLWRQGKYTYALVCASLPRNLQPLLGQVSGEPDFESFIAFDYVEVYVSPRVSAPRVDLKINGSDGPITVYNSTTLNLSWNVQYDPRMFEASCRGEGPNWNRQNLPPQGSERVSFNLPQGEYTYNFTCDFNPKCFGPGICPEMPTRSISDSVRVISRISGFPPVPTSTRPTVDIKAYDPQRRDFTDGPITLNVGEQTRVKWTSNGFMYNRVSCSKFGDWSGNVPPNGEEVFTVREAKEYNLEIRCEFSYRCEGQICPQIYLPDISAEDIVKIRGVATTTQLPDLQVFGIEFYKYDLPETPENKIITSSLVNYVGQQVTVKALLKNSGNADSSGFNVKWFLNGSQVGYGGHSPLRAGQVSNDNVRYLWRVSTGTYEFKFVADADNHVRESNENNNEFTLRVEISASQVRSNLILTIRPTPQNNRVTIREDMPLYISLENSTFAGRGVLYVGYVDPFGFPFYTFYHSSSTNPQNLKVTNLYFVKEQIRYFPDIFINSADVTPGITYGGPQVRLLLDVIEVPKGPELVKNNSFVNGLNDWEKEQPPGSQIEVKTYSYNIGEDGKTLSIKGSGGAARTRVIQWVPIENNSNYFVTVYGSYLKDSRQNKSVIAADEWCLGGRRGNTFVQQALNFESRPGSGSGALYGHAPVSNYFKSGTCDPDQDHRLAIFFDAFYNTQIEIAQVSVKKHLTPVVLKKVTISSLKDYNDSFEVALDGKFLSEFINKGVLKRDCSNLRLVYDILKTTSDLPYYIEGNCGEDGSRIWIKLPYAARDVIHIIYFTAHPDPSAPSESNPYNIFTFYDDFSSNRVGRELEFKTCSNGGYEVRDGILILKPGNNNQARPYIEIKKDFKFEENIPYVIEYRAKGDFYPYSQIISIFDWDGNIGGEWCGIRNGASAVEWGEVGKRIEVYENFNQRIISTSTASNTDIWNIYRVKLNYYFDVNAGATYYNAIYQKNDERELRATYKSSGYKKLGFSGREQFWSGNTYFDWIRVRKEIPVEIRFEDPMR